jgi:hypothetical protein
MTFLKDGTIMQKSLFSIPRLTSILAIAALTLAVSYAAPADAGAEARAETSTYLDGNLNGVSPNTGGTLLFSEEKAFYFRTGLSTVAVPYANISHTELGATKETSHDVPLYKVWALHKRFAKTETQLLIVNFKNDAGEEKTMTLELAKASAPGVMSLIQSRTGTDTAPAKALVASAPPVVAPVVSPEPAVSPKPVAAAEPARLAVNDAPAPPVESKREAKREAKLEAKQEAQDAKDAKLAAKKELDKNFATAKPDKPSDPWWGDDFWKTPRNADKWAAKTPMSTGNNEQR